MLARLLVLVLGLVMTGLLGIAPAEASSAATDVTVTVSAPAEPVTALVPTRLDVAVLRGGSPVSDVVVVVAASGPAGAAAASDPVSTSGDGVASLPLTFGTAGTWSLTATATVDSAPVVSAAVEIDVARSPTTVVLTAPAHTVSEVPVKVTLQVTSTATGRGLAGLPLSISTRLRDSPRWILAARPRTGADGRATVTLRLWKSSQVRTLVPASAAAASGAATVSVAVTPPRVHVAFRRGEPVPRVRYPVAPAAVGTGAHPVVGRIPSDVWASMQGLSWHKGCKRYSALRYIAINYWGFDGYRYRGHLVVASAIASRTIAVFSGLYALGYPIRSMFLPDRYGHHPYGPGANDYASMAADNTYGFNCRYVVGKEDLGAWSPHASGRAIDINTWENPYLSRRGPYPNSWWLSRARSNRALLRWSSLATRMFLRHGFSWGASYRDYQHFQA